MSGIGAALGAILVALGGFVMLPIDHASRYASHPQPAATYAEAVQRVERRQASEHGFHPDCHTTLLTHGARTAKALIFAPGYGSCAAAFKELGALFYDRGYNVLIVPLPHDGLADRMTTEQAKLKAEELAHYADEVVDIGRGLGDHVTLAGTSGGGVAAGWAAQQRRDLDRVVLISPGFGFAAVPKPLTRIVSKTFIRLPGWYIWSDPKLKKDAPPEHNYPRVSTRGLGQILRLSLATQALAKRNAPAVHSILVVTNLNDPDLDNDVTDKLAALWRAHGAPDVQAYRFPVALHLHHDLTDLHQPDQSAAALIPKVVFPKLLELIDR